MLCTSHSTEKESHRTRYFNFCNKQSHRGNLKSNHLTSLITSKKRKELQISEEEVKFAVDNFFEFKHEGGFDVIYDPHFLCSLRPSQRTEWAKKMKSLLKKHGCLITLIYPAYKYESIAPYTITPQL